MRRTLSQILQEADSIIEKRAAEPPPTISSDDEIFKLAETVRNHRSEMKTPEPIELTHEEKVAFSMAFLETLLSAQELAALHRFEKEAIARGLPQESVQSFYEKVAEKTEAGKRVFNFLTGVGESLESQIGALPSHGLSWRSAGQAAAVATPLAAAGAGGSYLKEREIKKKYGVS
jgi:hypothetical protein